jgi:hypothetical protein
VLGKHLETDMASWQMSKFIPIYDIHLIKCLWEVIQYGGGFATKISLKARDI